MPRLIPLGQDLWTVEGPPVQGAAGFAFPTRMCVARLSDGGLWLHSPIEREAELARELDALGPVRHIVAPNDLHHLYLSDWSSAHPTAQVHAAPGVAMKCPGVVVDFELEPAPAPDWQDCIEQQVFSGNRLTTETVFFHRPSGTVIFTDIVQQLPSTMNRGWRAAVARADRMTGATPSVPRKFRIAFRDRRALRAAIARVRGWPVRQLVMAHGPVIRENADRVLTQAFYWAR
ncbi:DUF4336 domain-containing protein [Mameliella sediminis]|uniref:DUF4336 domain-containing protein n=1 Tax=Mameliella sediminis TaxID=2836866 RepID=UPI001C484780|nr:DUF4336 domain-containing protein [Mameliella sediminis]MBV7393979.1 DUF4336 domain-containing protein [Mameliella sediminis]MBY6115925.1 DUF4336 domain-containing protein [Antarctobacter heliothermus]MBY6145297.1 DUF4336 domain-containing protein [Mameliella alba]MCA0955045.1 DUF4336 domain-containing protein [Mameliella alba]